MNESIATRMDEQGNSILAIRKDNIIKLFLKLKTETRRRRIGFVNTNTHVLHVKRKKEDHLYRKFNAYGFCYQIIADAKQFNMIRLQDEFSEWLIPTSFILDKTNAKFLHFKGLGFELQVFAPLEEIEQFKRPARF